MTTMTVTQQIILVVLAVAATAITRFLPFAIFSEDKPTPEYIQFLGKALPSAVFALLVVYCYRSIEWTGDNHGLPEIIASLVTIALHFWKRNMFLSMLGGTATYILLIQFVFS